ncbi:MAG: dTMP kinase [Lentisphaeria bacterium]|nr:dTMP kinase [Lentisphaeria bacterium]NQZ67234.1 dTMP kinase [Lentisphaeria bacterium]
MSGLFITFEGPEGAGKSTQIQLLKAHLESEGHDVLCTREPGGTKIGEELRHLVKHVEGDDAPCVESELLIFAASRAQLVQKLILPHLEKDGIVLCDRFADSTTAYQGYARGYDLEKIQILHGIATAGRWPDITILMDITAEKSFERRESRGGTDRFEEEGRQFHEAVRDGFLKLNDLHKDRFHLIDAAGSIDDLQKQIRGIVANALS